MFASCSDDGTVRIWQSPDAIHFDPDAAGEDVLMELKDEPNDVLRSSGTPSSSMNGGDGHGVLGMNL